MLDCRDHLADGDEAVGVGIELRRAREAVGPLEHHAHAERQLRYQHTRVAVAVAGALRLDAAGQENDHCDRRAERGTK